jgi:hypothetical protein
MAHTRRGTRIPVHIKVSVTSLDATKWFTEPGLVILANQHGCALRIRRSASVGTPVILEGLTSTRKMAAARVVNCISIGEYENLWLLGLELQEPGNVWGIDAPPDDWLGFEESVSLVDRVLDVWDSLISKKRSSNQVLH